MIDAAGAIYVIGGISFFGTFLNDVWVSTDGGARPHSRGDIYYRGTTGGTTELV